MIISSKIVKRKYTELPILANILSQYFQYCERFALIKVQYQSFSWTLTSLPCNNIVLFVFFQLVRNDFADNDFY